MKRIHVSLVLILVIITGVIFTNCQYIINDLASGGDHSSTHCPYCNAEGIGFTNTNTTKKDEYSKVEYRYYDYKCKNCGKSYRIYENL